jgi:hypothetical protein
MQISFVTTLLSLLALSAAEIYAPCEIGKDCKADKSRICAPIVNGRAKVPVPICNARENNCALDEVCVVLDGIPTCVPNCPI